MCSKEFLQGYDHFWNNGESSGFDNPYERDTDAWTDWCDGWYNASDDYHETDEE